MFIYNFVSKCDSMNVRTLQPPFCKDKKKLDSLPVFAFTLYQNNEHKYILAYDI